ncbi:DDE-type integrase/transposase/recombinase [Siccirubricoccus sp. G192]|nr:DDE-type integrase/transposase/recombinase [Siccirubricoccus sp. G192]
MLDILVQGRRNARAAKRFFKRLLAGLKYKPKRLITDGLRSYGGFCQASRPRRLVWPPGQRRVGSGPAEYWPGSREWNASAAVRPLSLSGRTAPPRAIGGSAAAIAGSSSTSGAPAC